MRRVVLVAVALLACVVLGTAGCAADPKAVEAARQREAALREAYESTIPVCADKVDCELKWGAAQRWVVSNVPWKIRLVTDWLIETYGCSSRCTLNAAIATSVLVEKVPTPDGRTAIRIKAWCDLGSHCAPDPWSAVVDFNAAVRAKP
jgi:hypothetical protein